MRLDRRLLLALWFYLLAGFSAGVIVGVWL